MSAAIYDACRNPKYLGYSLTMCEKLLAVRDAAIRKECADRGVAWFKKIFGVTEERLRAAIMGDKHE